MSAAAARSRMNEDRTLAQLFTGISQFEDADTLLFTQVFEGSYNLAHVERLLVVAQKLEQYVRFRKQWGGR